MDNQSFKYKRDEKLDELMKKSEDYRDGFRAGMLFAMEIYSPKAAA